MGPAKQAGTPAKQHFFHERHVKHEPGGIRRRHRDHAVYAVFAMIAESSAVNGAM